MAILQGYSTQFSTLPTDTFRFCAQLTKSQLINNLPTKPVAKLCCFCLLAVALILATVHIANAYPIVSKQLVYSRSPEHAHITIAAVGDIMLGTNYPYDRLPADEGNFLLEDISSFLTKADITIGNLEAVLIQRDSKVKKHCENTNKCFAFRTPPQYARHLRNAGFSAVSLANNHAFDFGIKGLIESKTHLAAHGIQSSGVKGDIAMWPDREVRTAMIAFSTYDYANDMNDIPNAKAMISQLDQFYDVVIVSFHGGAEGVDKAQLPFATEYYHGENRGDVVTFSHAMIDAGADLIIGHGPHVPRAIELYKERLIAYSLGNFATHEGIRIDKQLGYSPILLTTMNGSGEFICGQIVSARQSRNHGVRIDDEQLAYKEIRNRTNQDLSGGALHFFSDGNFTPADNPTSECGLSD